MMTKTYQLKQNPEYTLKVFPHSTWVRVEKSGAMLSLAMDLHSAYQTIYQDLHDNGENSEFITIKDFKEI